MNDTDFKYLIQDFSNYFIGARLTYDEMIDLDDMPGRFRSAIFKYMEDETPLDVRICDHLLSMDKKSKSAMIYSQLKTEITVLPNAAAGRMKQMVSVIVSFEKRLLFSVLSAIMKINIEAKERMAS